ncbi:MAG: PLP-dependent aminotransferase family protein [Solirubrobacteraceae bacterium]
MTQQKGPVAGELLITVDRAGALALHEQLERQIRQNIRSGALPAGMKLPSTRVLAGELGLSRGVVVSAYTQLAAEGYLETRQGAPVRVTRTVRPRDRRAPARSLLTSVAYDFHPALPDLAGFPRDSWLRSLRAAWRENPLDSIGYGDPRGAPQLRESLAEYLARARGAVADPEHMIMTAGFTQGFSMLCRWLVNNGVQTIAVEDPGWHPHRLIAEQAQLTVTPIPLDQEGLIVSELQSVDADAIVVTAAHQFPTGALLSAERRASLIDWAESADKLIIEDDYDSEYRYDRAAVGALQGLAPERVLHIGSASKRLAPGMRLAWLLTPSWLTWQLTSMKAVEDAGSEITGQLALDDFIRRGELDRHIRRMRLRYQARRETLLRALALSLPRAAPTGAPAGLYELVRLPEDLDEPALIAAASRHGVGIQGLSTHRFTHQGPPGLILGYANLSEPAIKHGVDLIAEASGHAQQFAH